MRNHHPQIKFRFFSTLALIGSLTFAHIAGAFSIDTNLFYFTDAFSASTESSSNRMFIDASLNLDLAMKGHLTIGWGYSIINMSDTSSGTTTTFSLAEMGPRVGYYLDKDKSWGLFATYNLQSKATYDTGSNPLEWRGGSYKLEFGYRPELFEQLRAGLHLIYYSASFSEELSNSTTYALISNSRSLIYPAFSLSYHFE